MSQSCVGQARSPPARDSAPFSCPVAAAGHGSFIHVKKIGIVGGVAWRSTVDYYAEICRRSEPQTPEISIESLDLNKAVSYLGVDGDEESWRRFDDYHRAALQCLEASGADFALMASNTPHHRFASIVRGIGIPVISIFDVVAKESARIISGAEDARNL